MDELTHFLPRIEQYRPDYAGLSKSEQVPEEAGVIIDTIYADFVVMRNRAEGESVTAYCHRLFGINEDNLATSVCGQFYETYMTLMKRFRSVLRDFNVLAKVKAEEDEAQRVASDKFSKALTAIYTMHEHIRSGHKLIVLSDPNSDHCSLQPETFLLRQNMDDLKPIHMLVLYTLDRLAGIQARRHNGYVMVPQITIDGGYNSTAFQPLCHIQQFPSRIIDREANFDMWKILVERQNNQEWLIKILSEHDNMPEFRDLDADRTVFAFENGIYNAREDKFLPFTKTHKVKTSLADDDADVIRDKTDAVVVVEDDDDDEGEEDEADDDVSPGQKAAQEDDTSMDILKSGVVACKYFKGKYFNIYTENADWRLIETPEFDQVLQAQDLKRDPAKVDVDQSYIDPAVYDWVLALMGRMIFAVGDKDSWQVALFFKGVAGSGKSTILRIIRSFYNVNDVGIMSNNIEKKFGLYPLAKMYVVMCYEMRGNFGLDQAELQCLVSGEELTMAIKHKSAAVSEAWTAPFAAAGNMLGDWEDSQGSISRRFILVEFAKAIKHSDPRLFTKIEERISDLLVKCVRAYHEKVADYGDCNLWDVDKSEIPKVLPQYFHDTKNALHRTTNSLVSFIRTSGEVKLCPDGYMTFKQFKAMYQTYCRTAGATAIKMSSPDSYSQIFFEVNISVGNGVEERSDPDSGELVSAVWLTGVWANMSSTDTQPSGQEQQQQQPRAGRKRNSPKDGPDPRKKRPRLTPSDIEM
jgi:phage/plasmid-associated DNA primase